MQDCTTCRHAEHLNRSMYRCLYPMPSPVKQRLIRASEGRALYVTKLGARMPVHPCPCWEESGVSAMEKCGLWGVEAQEDDGWQ
jgi:hypothetical protein